MSSDAINGTTMVVGGISYLEGFAAFTIKNGKYEAPAGDDYHAITGLNKRGQYVGYVCAGSVIQDGPYHAVLWQNGQKCDLTKLIPPDSGGDLERANAINNRGDIVGAGGYQDRQTAFKLVPRSLLGTRTGRGPNGSGAGSSGQWRSSAPL